MLVGRELQQSEGMKPQQCFIMPLLPGTDGVQKMSKSLGNYIGIDEPANEIFGKVMSIPDSMIGHYYEWLTDVPTKEVSEIKQSLENDSADAMDLKKRVAKLLVSEYHDTDSAETAQTFFEKTIQGNELPDDIQEYNLKTDLSQKGLRLSNILTNSGITSSTGEARRLIEQGAIKLDNETVTSNLDSNQLTKGVLRIGRRRYLRLI